MVGQASCLSIDKRQARCLSYQYSQRSRSDERKPCATERRDRVSEMEYKAVSDWTILERKGFLWRRGIGFAVSGPLTGS